MPLVLADRVRETTTTTGTGTVTLGGAVTGFQTFAAIGNGNTTYYAIAGQGTNEWEVGIGTYTAAGTTLSRDTVLASSNAGALVSFSAGVKDVFCDYPAGRAVYLDTATNATLPGLTVNGTQVISANSASDALRITQTGAGNALVVEDSANPDSSPFIVTTSGNVLVGATALATIGAASASVVQAQGLTTGSGFTAVNWPANANAAESRWLKSRSGVVGTNGIVSSGDGIGLLRFAADDGVDFIEAARISAVVDGTPGTNDMPGRLVFSTTADGASSPTERMRITNTGAVGIGTSTLTGYSLRVAKTITGATTSFGVDVSPTVQSDVTARAVYSQTNASTAAASFTLPTLQHYLAYQGTIGAGSTVTNQFGFSVDSSLTGATNNYGFYSNIASGTGRWNFYAAGTAENYFNGSTTFANNVSLSASTNGLLQAHVYNNNTGASTIARYLLSTGTANAYAISQVAENAGSPFYQLSSGPGILNGYFDFATHIWRNVAGTEWMRLNSTGLGVGTNAPGYKLDVSGTANATTVRASNGIVVNSQTVSADYTIASGDNGGSFGPVTVASGITVTVSSGSTWTVV